MLMPTDGKNDYHMLYFPSLFILIRGALCLHGPDLLVLGLYYKMFDL